MCVSERVSERECVCVCVYACMCAYMHVCVCARVFQYVLEEQIYIYYFSIFLIFITGLFFSYCVNMCSVLFVVML